MRKLILAASLLAVSGFSCAASAAEDRKLVVNGPFFICANEGFYLTQQGNSYHLTGPLYVPGPGYEFTLSDITVNEQGIARGNVSFKAPEEQKKQFVTPALNVDTVFSADTQVQRLHISIDKNWNWGDERIVCQKG